MTGTSVTSEINRLNYGGYNYKNGTLNGFIVT